MYFGYGAPTRPPLGTAANTRKIAAKAEEVGLSYVSIADHIFPPFAEKHPYPYTADGSTPWDDSGNVLECLTLASYIAGVTRKLRLVTGVMVVPLRNPLVTAKVLASIDVLSEGRLVVGCGAGWERKEFEVLGAPPFARRGTAVDEYLEVFRELWTSDTPAYEGEFVRVNGFAGNLETLPSIGRRHLGLRFADTPAGAPRIGLIIMAASTRTDAERAMEASVSNQGAGARNSRIHGCSAFVAR